jgi:hypothetical protein
VRRELHDLDKRTHQPPSRKRESVKDVSKILSKQELLENQAKIQSENDKIFAIMCLKNKNEAEIAEAARQEQQKDALIQIGNSHAKNYVNFSINNEVSLDQYYYKELVEAEANLTKQTDSPAARKPEAVSDPIISRSKAIADASSFNFDSNQREKDVKNLQKGNPSYQQVESTYELLQDVNIKKLRELRELQE